MDRNEIERCLDEFAAGATFGTARDAAPKLRRHIAAFYDVPEDSVVIEEVCDGNITVRAHVPQRVEIAITAVPR